MLDGKTPALPLDSFFALNPAMPNLHRLYKAGPGGDRACGATPYRERSHFDGQDVLESGLPKPGRADTGWLNRALGALEPEARVRRDGRAFAVGPVTPLVVRGPAPVMSWTPPRMPPASEDTMMRLLDLYRHTDSGACARARGPDGARDAGARASDPAAMAPTEGGSSRRRASPRRCAPISPRPPAPRRSSSRAPTARASARSPSTAGTRTSTKAPTSGRLATLLGALDGAIAAIETNMGEAWRETVVAVVTEFGRTARINGTDGTDHGTATVALLAGGALKGGRVIADWPGLKDADLYEGRDLKPTTDLRAVLKGLLKDHLRVDRSGARRATCSRAAPT